MLSSTSSSLLATPSIVPSNCPLKQAAVDLTNRKRVSKACLECKKRHCRCDHQRPCARCAKLGLDCVDAPTCKRGPPKGTSYKKRKRTNDTTTTEQKKKSVVKKSKNIKNVQIKVEPGPYITTNVTVVDEEPSAKKRRIEVTQPVTVNITMNNHHAAAANTMNPTNMTSSDAAAAAAHLLLAPYLEAFGMKHQEMESPMTMFGNNMQVNSVDSVLTPTQFLETPKLELQPTTQFTSSYSQLPDIEDLTVGMCMNTDCGANFNHHCMVNELDISPNIGLSSLFNTTPTLQQQAPLIILNTPAALETASPFAFDELSDILRSSSNFRSTTPATIGQVSADEEFLLS